MNRFLLTCLLSLVIAYPEQALSNPCDNGGIGGTGISLQSGIGGTGIRSDHGIGGTGIDSGHGIGGTGIDSGGIGGTGIDSSGHGIGGTGDLAENGFGGTGIVGIITGFGSICVSGLEVHFYNNTPVEMDGKSYSSSSLSIGDTVVVNASGKEEFLVAREIHVYHQVVGPITSIDLNGHTIQVMNQLVNANQAAIRGLQIGQWVSVSGLRESNGNIVATKIETVSLQKSSQLVGNITHIGNAYYIGSTKIEGLVNPNNLNPNADFHLSGNWNGNAFRVLEMSLGPVSRTLDKVEIIHLQGIASGNVSNGLLNVSGKTFNLTEQSRSSINGANLEGKLITIHGINQEGKLKVDKIDFKPLVSPDEKLKGTFVSPTNTQSAVPSIETNSTSSTSQNSSSSSRIDQVNRTESLDRIDRPEKIDRPDRVEVPDRVEIPDRVEVPDRVDRPDRSGKDN